MEWVSHGARYYNSEWGRFISPDPKREFYNQYSYCWDDPVNVIDRDGRGGSGIDAKLPVLTSWGYDTPIAAWELDINLALLDWLEKQTFLGEIEEKEKINNNIEENDDGNTEENDDDGNYEYWFEDGEKLAEGAGIAAGTTIGAGIGTGTGIGIVLLSGAALGGPVGITIVAVVAAPFTVVGWLTGADVGRDLYHNGWPVYQPAHKSSSNNPEW